MDETGPGSRILMFSTASLPTCVDGTDGVDELKAWMETNYIGVMSRRGRRSPLAGRCTQVAARL